MANSTKVSDITKNLQRYTLRHGSIVPQTGWEARDILRNGMIVGCVCNEKVYNVSSRAIKKNPSLYENRPYIEVVLEDGHSVSSAVRTVALAHAQVSLIKVPYRGNLKKMLKKANKGKLDFRNGVLEYLCLIKEEKVSTQILQILFRDKVIPLGIFLKLAITHNRDVAEVMNYDRILSKLVSALESEDDLLTAYAAHKAYLGRGTRSIQKVTLFLRAVIKHPLISTQTLEEILYSGDEIFSLVQYDALHVIRNRDEYSDMPKSWLLKMFQLA